MKARQRRRSAPVDPVVRLLKALEENHLAVPELHASLDQLDQDERELLSAAMERAALQKKPVQKIVDCLNRPDLEPIKNIA